MPIHITQLCVVLLATISAVTAHIKILYPALRGPNVAQNQPLFCGEHVAAIGSLILLSPCSIRFAGGYNNTGTRAAFPLNTGFVLYATAHPVWTG